MEIAKTRLGGWKAVEKEGLPSYYHMRIMERLTFDNPAYIGMARHRPKVLAWQIKKGTAPPKHLKFYRQNESQYYVPRAFDLGLEEEIIEDLRVTVPCELPEPAFPLWDIQKDAIEAWEKRGAEEGVLILPTGSGKTVLGLEIARRLKQRLLIITNRVETGLDNWVKDCQAYLGFKPGTIQGTHIDYVGHKVVVATFQTLNSKRDLMKELREEFGVIVLDEVQHVPADTFATVTNNFRAKYRYGLTATEKRADGLTAIIFATMGGIIFERRRADEIAPVGVKIIRTGITLPPDTEHQTYSGDYNKCLKWLIQNQVRNDLMCRQISDVGYKDRWHLAVSHRVWHVKYIANELAKVVGAENVGILVANPGGKEKGMPIIHMLEGIETNQRKVIERAREGSLRYVVGTYQYVSEGLDVPRWDILHLMTPTKNDIELTQVMGRCRRSFEGKEKALVKDYADMDGMFFGFYRCRVRIYEKLQKLNEEAMSSQTKINFG